MNSPTFLVLDSLLQKNKKIWRSQRLISSWYNLWIHCMYRRGAFLSKKGLWNSTEVPLHLNKIHLNDHWKSNDNTFLLKSLRRRTLCKLPSLLVTTPQNYKQFLTAQWVQKPGESFVVTEGTSGWSQVKLKGLQAGLVQFQPPEYFGFMIREETEKGPKGTRVFISPTPAPRTHTHFLTKG